MKAAKFLVLGGGIIGLIAFFLPLISVAKSGVEGQLSAFQIVKGIDAVEDVVDTAEGTAAGKTVEGKQAVAEANEALGAVKMIVLAIFVPAIFLTLFGALGAKKRFGRGLGIGSLLFGLIGLGIWALLNSAASDAGGGESAAGIGLHLLLITGLGGLIGGLLGAIKPEPKTA
jgi:hypothetical protein